MDRCELLAQYLMLVSRGSPSFALLLLCNHKLSFTLHLYSSTKVEVQAVQTSTSIPPLPTTHLQPVPPSPPDHISPLWVHLVLNHFLKLRQQLHLDHGTVGSVVALSHQSSQLRVKDVSGHADQLKGAGPGEWEGIGIRCLNDTGWSFLPSPVGPEGTALPARLSLLGRTPPQRCPLESSAHIHSLWTTSPDPKLRLPPCSSSSL